MSCRADATVDVWLDKGNIAEFVVYTEDSSGRTYVTDLSGVTRGVVCIGSLTEDSDDDATIVWWTDSVSSKTLPSGETFTGDVVRARLGQITSLAEGVYSGGELLLYGTIESLVYDDTTGPLVISDSIQFNVLDTCS